MNAPAASGSSFYAGMKVLPRAERHAMYAVYDFCRIVDDIADDQRGDRATRAAQLDRWRADLDSLYGGGDPGVAAMLAPHVRRFGLLREDFEAVIDGMAMDVAGDIRWPTAAILDLYCDRVASAVGRLSVRIFGMDEAQGIALSHHLGRALQLTNILRDIDEDAGIGRVYLPLEAIEAQGIAVGDIDQVIGDRRIDGAARLLADQALRHFGQAQDILRSRPSGHLIAPKLMAAAYSSLLRRMQRVGWTPPRTRVRHNRLALAWTLVRLRLSR
ncbi:presqualene diphosphate synthase HpnD [Sphingomonas abietis]|uniref:Presqualene diphosphate synthase HpnD n=1 Tax=Sphingomonas abietis TaxID=3012344 RepID=A0ABY7NN89_9SPHN|nr:presqualene diphosphate synthase HpnD [Sphingomonas abietis]WBO22999.1 presqualene diphosphate synthase HpnD [Sphingomonas abietis]